MIARSKRASSQSSLITIECFLITHTALFVLINRSNFEMKGYIIGKGLECLFSTHQCQPGIQLSFFFTRYLKLFWNPWCVTFWTFEMNSVTFRGKGLMVYLVNPTVYYWPSRSSQNGFIEFRVMVSLDVVHQQTSGWSSIIRNIWNVRFFFFFFFPAIKKKNF